MLLAIPETSGANRYEVTMSDAKEGRIFTIMCLVRVPT